MTGAALAGSMAGWVMGLGASGFAWMNPYIALALTLSGAAFAVTVAVGTHTLDDEGVSHDRLG